MAFIAFACGDMRKSLYSEHTLLWAPLTIAFTKMIYFNLFTHLEQHKWVRHFVHCSIRLINYQLKAVELNRLKHLAKRKRKREPVGDDNYWKRYVSPNWHHIEPSSSPATMYPIPINLHHLIVEMSSIDPECRHSMHSDYIVLAKISDRE